MKRKFILVAAAILTINAALPAQELSSAEKVIQKVANKLAAVKLLGYKYRFDYRFPSQERSREVVAEAFLDLQPADGSSKFRFQFTTLDSSSTFNGTERFILDKTNKKLYVDKKPSFQGFGNIFLENSPISMKYALPKIISDRSIAKKVTSARIGDRDLYLIEFSLPKKTINSAGDIIEIRPDHTVKYLLKVDKSSLFIVEATQTNDKNDETLTTSFTEISEKPPIPSESSWYFSTYQNDYTLQSTENLTLVEKGKQAPGFSLARVGAGPAVSMDQYKGKLVLLEFWIAQCGFCISAVPKLNAISRKFRHRELETVSINMYDSAALIDRFQERYDPEYTILVGGDSIANQYGVGAYPAIVLIDKGGKVVYSSSGLFEKELEAAIVAELEK